MILHPIASRAEYEHAMRTLFVEAFAYELFLARRHNQVAQFTLPGICKVCNRPSEFLVDRERGAIQSDGIWHPNWRERQVCERCGLNSRQRSVVAFVANAILNCHGKLRVYLMEQVTPVYAKCHELFASSAQIVGSEYLGPGCARGSIIDGVRHEDAESLSFADRAFELVVSNDVLEHVPDPTRALREAARVLEPEGALLLTAPFYPDRDENAVRATLEDGHITHQAPPIYHGNPMSPEGSLVFTDFGWQLLAQMRAAGFRSVVMHLFWNPVYGHCGVPESFLLCRK